MKRVQTVVPAMALWLVVTTLAAAAFDAHAGYYYPEAQTQEVYISDLALAEDTGKRSRAAFVSGLASQNSKLGYPPGYHLFAKGTELEKLIVVATGDGRYDTLFRLRALLASLTSMARTTDLFAQSNQPQDLNFLDLCKLIGFTQVTVSNGKDVTHQIKVR
ncbi:hypothetical protein [Stappia sp. BW2]|uniref:hypothetical protein n=1 Tax=Stappia sp. BW2 TaxID=2592622 RepID=UPI001AD930E6|nr:hypothetical protein [Stappia sp. BW2]